MTSLIFWKKKFKIRSRGGDIERFHVFFRIALQRHQVVASIQFLHSLLESTMLYRSVYESQLYDSPVMSNHIDPVRIFSYNFSTCHLRSATYDSKNKSGVYFSTFSTNVHPGPIPLTIILQKFLNVKIPSILAK